jgi:hypothetical protein
MEVEFQEHLSGYWVHARFRTLEEAREVAQGVIRSPGTETVEVQTMQKHVEPNGRTFWSLGSIERWAPCIEAIDTSDTFRVIHGCVGKYPIGDEFVCWCMSAEERKRWKERHPEDAEWLDNPPWGSTRRRHNRAPRKP